MRLLFTFFLSVHAMYDTASTKVERLSDGNFDSKVMNSDELWMVEFYSNGCGHCRNLEPHWEKAAKALKGVVKVGAVDVDQNQGLSSKYQVTGIPTIKFFGDKKKSPQEYNGGRTTEDIVSFSIEKVSSTVKKRIGGGGSSDSGSGSSSKSSGGGGRKSNKDEVIVLDESNFNALVMGSKDIWMIEFYAPWCGHCKNLEPEWKQAAQNLKGQVKLAKVDATENQQLASRFGVQGYPTIKVFEYGVENKKDSKAIPYNGERTASGITAYGMSLAEQADIDPEVHEIFKQKIYNENCEGPVICVINFLPNIFDSNAKERKSYIDMIAKVAKLNRKQPIRWFWLQAGDQLDLERSLNLGFGFPAVVAISPSKKMIATMKGGYSENGINEFISNLLIGKGGLEELRDDFKVKKVDKWDGKDAPALEDDSYMYDEL